MSQDLEINLLICLDLALGLGLGLENYIMCIIICVT